MMHNHEFITLLVEDGTTMEAYIAFPEELESFPAIILLQEAFGVNSHIRNIAERLCKEGYAVIAPELFHRTGHRIEIAYTDFPSVAPHLQVISFEGVSKDLTACYEWLLQQPPVLEDKIGSIGFCMGGRVAFQANTQLPLAAAVSFYGGGIDKMAALAEQLHGAQLFFWGGLDAHIKPESIDAAIVAVKAAGKEYSNVVISYADHGFNCDERKSYHPLAAKEAWAHTLSFLENRLKN